MDLQTYWEELIKATYDVNGDKKPNRMGRDVFIFVQNQRGLVPAGLDVDFDEYCNIPVFSFLNPFLNKNS